MQPLEGNVESFIVSGRPSESRGPGEGSFDDPTTREQHEAPLGYGVLDHLQAQAMLLSSSAAFGPV